MLMAGVQNLPVTDPGFSDFMTMKMIGVGQTLPFPGKLSLRTRAAEYEVAAATARLNEAGLTVAREVRSAYYDLVFADRAFDIVRRNQEMLAALVPVSEAHYSSGTGNQTDVLRLRVEAARLADDATLLTEERRATLARLNAALTQPSDAAVTVPTLPERIARLAVRDSATRIRFVSSALGSRVADSPIPSVDSLQAIAIRQNPSLRAHEATIAAQATRAELAGKEHLPDFDVSVQYGQRDGFSDMVTATVSIPLPLQKGRKQDAELAEARSELAALAAEHHTMRNELAAKVAELHSALERGRSQLALYVKAILPQARATLSSASAGYQVGRVDFISLLEAQATLFEYETQYHRALTDFAKTLALLEEQVGAEVVR
jgi:cobalt-zinc-cadmium efflux system outer membrane protein